MIIESKIHGIPCQLEVTHYHSVPGNPSTWDSDWDYTGFTDIDFDVLDRNGRPAPWLERKLTEAEYKRLESELIKAVEKENSDE